MVALTKGVLIPAFTVTRQIDAPVEKVWEVLHDFGNVSRWNDGIKTSALTSEGPVAEGSTRSCEFAPFGSVSERIHNHEQHERMTIHIFEASKLPISSAVADFNLTPNEGGTEVTIDYSYEPNLLGKLMKGYTHKQMEKGIAGVAKNLDVESRRIAAA